MTAGVEELQRMKVESVGISWKKVPVITVSNSSQKPRKMIDYIIALWYVPWKIILYEDRPECFLDEISSLRQLFPNTEFVIDKVTLHPPWRLRQIDQIEQQIFPKSVL